MADAARVVDTRIRVGGGEKVRQFGGQKAPVEWLRLGYGPAQGPGRNSGRLVL